MPQNSFPSKTSKVGWISTLGMAGDSLAIVVVGIDFCEGPASGQEVSAWEIDKVKMCKTAFLGLWSIVLNGYQTHSPNPTFGLSRAGGVSPFPMASYKSGPINTSLPYTIVTHELWVLLSSWVRGAQSRWQLRHTWRRALSFIPAPFLWTAGGHWQGIHFLACCVQTCRFPQQAK